MSTLPGKALQYPDDTLPRTTNARLRASQVMVALAPSSYLSRLIAAYIIDREIA